MNMHSHFSAAAVDLIDVGMMRDDYAPMPDIAHTLRRDFYSELARWRDANQKMAAACREVSSC